MATNCSADLVVIDKPAKTADFIHTVDSEDAVCFCINLLY